MDISEIIEWRAVNKFLDVIKTYITSKFVDLIIVILLNPDYTLISHNYILSSLYNSSKMQTR
jgi:hypothetical protein